MYIKMFKCFNNTLLNYYTFQTYILKIYYKNVFTDYLINDSKYL